jgi:NitT/TauT family transport system substrate-binding protein
VLHGLRLGLLDVGALTLDEALRLHAELGDLRVILVMDISHGGDGVVGGPAVPRLSDLAGRRVGVEDSALGLYVLSRAAELGGVPLDALLPVHLPVHAQADAFRRGEVDAVVTFDPTFSALVAEGGHRLLGSEALPGEIVDVMVARAGTRASRADELAALIAAWHAAVALVQRGPDGGRAPFTARLGPGLPPDAPVYAGLRFPAEHEQAVLLDPAVGELPGALRRFSAVLGRLGHLPEGFDGDGLLAPAAP